MSPGDLREIAATVRVDGDPIQAQRLEQAADALSTLQAELVEALEGKAAFAADAALLRKQKIAAESSLTQARDNALEEAAKVVDQCNREGPYNAIGAASRIRSLKSTALAGEGE